MFSMHTSIVSVNSKGTALSGLLITSIRRMASTTDLCFLRVVSVLDEAVAGVESISELAFGPEQNFVYCGRRPRECRFRVAACPSGKIKSPRGFALFMQL